MIDYSQEEIIVNQAFEAAKQATEAHLQQHGEGAYCGFAWVNVKPGTSRIAKYLKSKDLARNSYYGGLDVWNPGGSHTQCMLTKEVGARAFAKVLQAHGIRAHDMSRPD